MNSTNVPSKRSNDQKRNNPVLAGGQVIATRENEKEALIIPPETAKLGISVNEAKNGELEIPAGNGRLNENNTLEMDNGNVIKMENERAYQNVVSAKNEREEMDRKAKQKVAQAGVDR